MTRPASRHRSGSLLRAMAAWGAVVAFAPSASAFCRTTTCDPNVSCATDPVDCCIIDGDGCDQNGMPISWPSACVSYNVHEEGSLKLGITADELREVLDVAYDTWLTADCGAGRLPSLSLDYRGFASCHEPEYNEDSKDYNANIWMFRDDAEGRVSSGGRSIDVTTLAVTLVSFNYKTAEIYDVDVELNSGLANFTLDDHDVDIDLASVVTHEAGHFLGLDHSRITGATMASGYVPGDTSPRSLFTDDERGICAAYPEDRTITRRTCDPRGQYNTACDTDQGCSYAGPARGAPTGALWAAAALGVVAFLRRRKVAQTVRLRPHNATRPHDAARNDDTV